MRSPRPSSTRRSRFIARWEDHEQRYILKQVFLSLMRYCLTPLGMAMVTLPAFAGAPDGPRAGPSFEIYAEVSLLPQMTSAWRYFAERLGELAAACDALGASSLSAAYPKLRAAIAGVAGDKNKPGLSAVLRKYALLVKVGLEPPATWTWEGGVRAFFSPLDVSHMGTWLEDEAAVKAKAATISGRIDGPPRPNTMPPSVLLEDADGAAKYRNPEGRWTKARVDAFNAWAGPKPPDPYVCPGAPTWNNAVKAMFTQGDIACMGGQGLDLGSYAAVRDNADEILSRVTAGDMPPGRPWPASKVACFKLWIDSGRPEGAPEPPAPAR